MPIRQRPEEALQRAVASYLDLALPPDCYWFAVPNQRGTRKRFEMGILQAMGVKAGAPEIVLCWCGMFHAMELKPPTSGSLSKDQKDARDAIYAAGGSYAVCRSLEDVARTLDAIGVPLRARPIGCGVEIIPPDRKEMPPCQISIRA